MVLACLIAAAGIILDSPILIIGAMVVGPEFGPIAGFCVAAVQRRPDLMTRCCRWPSASRSGSRPPTCSRSSSARSGLRRRFSASEHPLTQFISHPDAFSFIVAYFAGAAGVLSLTNAKSGALVGVLISVTTIPAAANIGVAAAYTDGEEWIGAMEQLALNLYGDLHGSPDALHPAQALPAAAARAPSTTRRARRAACRSAAAATTNRPPIA